MNRRSSATVFVVDDDEAVRDALTTMLRAAGHAAEAFASAEAFLSRIPQSRSGCVVLDVRMPGMSGLELHERLAERAFPLPVIFLTAHGDVPMAVRAVKRGAFDFVLKPLDDRHLMSVIDAALEFSQRRLANNLPDQVLSPVVATLSRREREVLDRILAGRQTRAIAEELYISVKTVEFHRGRIHEKLGVSSMAELFNHCMRGSRPSPQTGD